MKPPDRNHNALAYAFAAILGRELDLKVAQGIFQLPRAKRDLQSFWRRFSNPVLFYGEVSPGCDYILADDVYTLGGTFCGLRALIESQGSRVICITALAGNRIGSEPIALDERTLMRLRSRYGSDLGVMLNEEVGYGVEQLTEREAQALLKQPCDVVGLRALLVRARDRSNAG